MDERNDINKYREKRIRRKKQTRLIVFVLAAAAIIIIVINWKQILAPFKDIRNRNTEGGFPISIAGSANYVIGDMGENFYLLTDTYLYTYNTDGAELSDKQHGFQNPICSSNSKRALVFDKNGKDLKVYSRNAEIFAKSFDDTIVFAKMGTDDRSAVVTTSARYSNYLYVLNSEGKQIFRWASPDEKIMQVCFGDGDKNIYVSVVGEKGGSLNSSILRFEVGDNSGETWRTHIGTNVSYSLEMCADGLYTVTAAGAYLLDQQTGEIKASNSFSGEIAGIPETDGVRSMLFRDSASNGEIIIVYSDVLEAVNALTLNNLSALEVKNGRLYALCGSVLTVYDSALKPVNTIELDDEYSDIKVIGNSAYLLGYNQVRKQELK